MAGSSRQVVFGVDPRTQKGLVAEFDWPYVADGNADGELFTCAFAPAAKSTKLSAHQSSVFLGTKTSNLTIQTFRTDLNQDDSTDVAGEAITNRIDPTLAAGAPPDGKEFFSLDFIHTNPYERMATIDYAAESDSPHTDSVAWTAMFWEAGRSSAYFTSAVARWIHLRIRTTAASPSRLCLGPFNVVFIRLFQRDTSETG